MHLTVTTLHCIDVKFLFREIFKKKCGHLIFHKEWAFGPISKFALDSFEHYVSTFNWMGCFGGFLKASLKHYKGNAALLWRAGAEWTKNFENKCPNGNLLGKCV